MQLTFDILGLGCVAIDDLLYVPMYPQADCKIQVQRRDRQCGGLTGTALVAAARLGSKCVYAGTLGTDELSRFVTDRFVQEGIEVAIHPDFPNARPIHSVIVVDESKQTRTIFYDLAGVHGAQEDWPEEQVIRSARVLYVDHFGVEGMIRAARIARSAGIAVVADFERNEMPQFPKLLELVDHVIVSREFARKLTGRGDPRTAATSLWTNQRKAVIITCGEKGCWYVSESDPTEPQHQPAFAVRAVDTTGCGDVFHGAYASALARGVGMLERVRFAAAAAALKAMQRGGQAGIPSLAAVEVFLKEESL